ncbi:MAG TPA: hypothetical protein VIH58_06160 [Chthoniobacterales bacterium]|jgi:hypothetical protein
MTPLFAVQSAVLPDDRYFLYWCVIVVLWLPIGSWILGQVDGWKRLYRKFPAPAEALTGPKFSFQLTNKLLPGRCFVVESRWPA